MAPSATDLPFTKWEGCGNDYLFVDLRGASGERIEQRLAAAPTLARRLCDRRFGVGADGLVLVLSDPEADLRLAMWNADGSRGAICGTALRCAASLLADERGARAALLRLASDVGFHGARLERNLFGEPRVAVEIGAPRFATAAIPFLPERVLSLGAGAQFRAGDEGVPGRLSLELEGHELDGAVLSMGNPHLVLRTDRPPAEFDVPRWAAPLERAACFPDRANVTFAYLRPDGELEQRTFERGSGETLSCGSAACATVVAFSAAGWVPRAGEIKVHVAGGALGVHWTPGGEVWLSGPAQRVFTGRVAIA
jgi:diaminopimelate epimerase